jgi:multimeric flavodoxin WrbA
MMSDKKVLVFMGSPRKEGNSNILAGRAAHGAKRAGAQVEIFHLNGMDIRPCQACESCRKKGSYGCIQDDDMQALYPKLRAADAIILAGPVYWFTIGAQTKLLMDRLYALGGDDGYALAGKRVGIILTYADADPFSSGAVNALRAFQDAFAFVGAQIVGMVYGSAAKVGEIRSNGELMAKAYELGKQLGS